MAVNVGLLQKTLDTIKANPQHWNQKTWHCGTSHCFAGFAELIANNIPIETSSEDLVAIRHTKLLPYGTGSYAEKLLGISDDDGEALFHGHNTLEELECMVAYLIEHGSLEDFEDYTDEQ